MFQRIMDKISKELSNVFGIFNYILGVVYNDCRNHDNILRVPLIHREINLKLNKEKSHSKLYVTLGNIYHYT